MASHELNIEYVSSLARLALSEEEKAIYSRQLEQVLGHMATLAEIDTTGVEPMAHAFPLTNVLETDEARSALDPEVALANAPEAREQQFVVPKVVEDA